MSNGAAEQILACWSREDTANGTEGGVGEGWPAGGLQGRLGFDPREEERGSCQKPTEISAAGSQVGQMTLVFHSSLKHRIDLGTGKSSGGKGRQP